MLISFCFTLYGKMWKLINVKKEHLEQYFIVGEDVVVGRKDATLLITNDPSISRKHATLYVKHPEENVGNSLKPSSLFLRDEGSKYGTFKNGVRITSVTELVNNDILKFGQFESEFRVCQLRLVVTTSCLDISQKRDLKKIIHSLGGHFVSEWLPACSHLVMSEVKVTVKALCCLCSAKAIVLPDYFVDLKNSIKNKSTSAVANQYIPPIGEALIDKEMVSFDINKQRKSLFNNKNFIFLDEKQFKKLHLGIVLGGGNASLLSPEKVTSDFLLPEGCCIIEPMKESSQESNTILQKILSILQKKKLRMIPESDVGLAVAYCSTEKFCNPEFNMGDAVLRSPKVQSQTLTEREVYVPDTQERIISTQRAKDNVTEICNSLNFSGFRGDGVEEMELSEVPLSAQVKRELAEIFDEPMEEIFESPPKKKIVPIASKKEVESHKLKSELSTFQNSKSFENNQNKESIGVKKNKSVDQHNILVSNNSSNIEKQVKSEENHYTNGHVNGITTSPKEKLSIKYENHVTEKNGFNEPELPRNLMKVEIVPLICKRNTTELATPNYKNNSGKNFKKFKKVQSKKSQALPRIIGAHELVPFDKVAAQFCNVTFDDPPEEVPRPIKGAFDWDTPFA